PTRSGGRSMRASAGRGSLGQTSCTTSGEWRCRSSSPLPCPSEVAYQGMTYGVCGYTSEMGAKPALVRMLLAGRDEGRDLEEALDGLARIFSRPRTAERGGPHFTCREANFIAYVLVASRHVDAAIVWLDMHAASDTDEDPHGGADFDAAHYIYTGGR